MWRATSTGIDPHTQAGKCFLTSAADVALSLPALGIRCVAVMQQPDGVGHASHHLPHRPAWLKHTGQRGVAGLGWACRQEKRLQLVTGSRYSSAGLQTGDMCCNATRHTAHGTTSHTPLAHRMRWSTCASVSCWSRSRSCGKGRQGGRLRVSSCAARRWRAPQRVEHQTLRSYSQVPTSLKSTPS